VMDQPRPAQPVQTCASASMPPWQLGVSLLDGGRQAATVVQRVIASGLVKSD